ncbi:MAG: hypothetical protein ACM3OO_04470 [Planctomycetaceae bacterium]
MGTTPTDPPEPQDAQEPRWTSEHHGAPRSRFEDLSVPLPAAAPIRRRTPTVTTAALILLVSGALTLLTVFLLKPSTGLLPLFAVLGALQLLGGGLVIGLLPIGRALGLALGAVGVVVGLSLLGSNALNGLMTMALNGYVIYALASSGPSFRR